MRRGRTPDPGLREPRAILLSSRVNTPEVEPPVLLLVYGISNCDTVTAARQWLKERGIAHEFHDLRKEHVDAHTIERWLEELGREHLINKSSATWRTLDRTQREQVDRGNPVPVILANPTLVRRPVLVGENLLHSGFNKADYERLFPLT